MKYSGGAILYAARLGRATYKIMCGLQLKPGSRAWLHMRGN